VLIDPTAVGFLGALCSLLPENIDLSLIKVDDISGDGRSEILLGLGKRPSCWS